MMLPDVPAYLNDRSFAAVSPQRQKQPVSEICLGWQSIPSTLSPSKVDSDHIIYQNTAQTHFHVRSKRMMRPPKLAYTIELSAVSIIQFPVHCNRVPNAEILHTLLE